MYLLTAIGLTIGGSITVHIDTQIIHADCGKSWFDSLSRKRYLPLPVFQYRLRNLTCLSLSVGREDWGVVNDSPASSAKV